MFVRVLDDPIAGATDPVVCDCWGYLRPHRRRKRNGTRTKSSPDREVEMMQGMRGVIALMDYNVRATRKLRNCSRDPREKLVQLMRMGAQQWERALFEGETGPMWQRAAGSGYHWQELSRNDSHSWRQKVGMK